jgi:hypothetical protein
MTKRLTIFYQNARMIYLLTAKIQTPVSFYNKITVLGAKKVKKCVYH